jgi:hypothetical protein
MGQVLHGNATTTEAIAAFNVTASANCRTSPIGFFHVDIAEVRTEEGSYISSSPSTERQSSPL